MAVCKGGASTFLCSLRGGTGTFFMLSEGGASAFLMAFQGGANAFLTVGNRDFCSGDSCIMITDFNQLCIF